MVHMLQYGTFLCKFFVYFFFFACEENSYEQDGLVDYITINIITIIFLCDIILVKYEMFYGVLFHFLPYST